MAASVRLHRGQAPGAPLPHVSGAAFIPKGKKEIIIMFEWDREVDSLVFWPVMLTVVSLLGWIALTVR